MKRILITTVTMIFIISSTLHVQTNAATVPSPPPALTAGAAVLMDYNTGEVLYGKNPDKRYGPASTTKVMTALLTLENCKLDDIVTVGKEPPFEGGSKIYVLEGEKLTIEQMLYGLMLTSGNDVANALAEHISGSVPEFAKLMTKRAKELGCKNTNFSNANGYRNNNHYTSARDLAMISREAMKNPVFRKVVSTVSYQIPPTNKQKEIRYLHNHNKMLSVPSKKYPGADGVKTGYTFTSRYTYVGSATRNGRRLIVTILNDGNTFYNETRSLLNYGYANFFNKELYKKEDLISYLKPAKAGSGISIPVYPESDVEVTLKKGDSEEIVKNISIDNNLSEIKKGDVVGKMSITYGSNKKMDIKLIAGKAYSQKATDSKKISHKVFKLSNLRYLVYIGVLLFLARGFYRKYKRKGRLL